MPFCVKGRCYSWQMLYAILKWWQMLLPRGRCYPLHLWLADVIANFAVVGVIPLTVCCNTLCWLVLLPSARWNSQILFVFCYKADVIFMGRLLSSFRYDGTLNMVYQDTSNQCKEQYLCIKLCTSL